MNERGDAGADDEALERAQRRPAVVGLVLVVFFVLSLFTNILGALLPDIIATFRLSLTAAGLLPFSFFIAYGLTSIPAGIWIESSSEKRVMLASWSLAFVAALAFVIFRSYAVAIVSLFAMGVSMAALQVAVNPLLRVAGGASRFAFFSTLGQLVFGAASFVSPRIYASIASAPTSAPGAEWISIYWILAGLAFLMILVVALARLPSVERTDDERAGSLAMHRSLFRLRAVPLYFVSVFMYVGSEQGVASWLSQFLASEHGLDPKTTGANAVSWFWGLMTIGCVIGLGLLKVVADSRKILIGVALCAMTALALGLFGGKTIAPYALPAIGLFASVMWPIIFSLALAAIPAHHGTMSGILCTAIIGGALVPLAIGRLADHVGLRSALALLFLTLGWVLSVGIWSSAPKKAQK